jgi:hypothetical protein
MICNYWKKGSLGTWQSVGLYIIHTFGAAIIAIFLVKICGIFDNIVAELMLCRLDEAVARGTEQMSRFTRRSFRQTCEFPR